MRSSQDSSMFRNGREGDCKSVLFEDAINLKRTCFKGRENQGPQVRFKLSIGEG